MSRCLTLLLLLFALPALAQPPRAAAQYQRYITATAHATFGVDAPIATLAAQLAQESAWNAGAASWVGASGLAQFMPSTAQDMAKFHPDACAPANPLDPRWAIRCQQRYMRDLAKQTGGRTECDNWAFALSSYNGGAGWLKRDQRQCRADPVDVLDCITCVADRWFGNVERTPDRRRAPSNIKQNRDYVNRILLQMTPQYRTWGRGIACE